MAAQVQHRYIEEPLQHEIQDIEDAARPAVAVVEGMDALELIVDYRHLHEGIRVEEGVVIDEALEVGHERDVGARQPTEACPVMLKLFLDAH